MSYSLRSSTLSCSGHPSSCLVAHMQHLLLGKLNDIMRFLNPLAQVLSFVFNLDASSCASVTSKLPSHLCLLGCACAASWTASCDSEISGPGGCD